MNRNIDFTVGPYQLALDITNKCNLRCLHCYNASGENRVMEHELSDDEIVEFLFLWRRNIIEKRTYLQMYKNVK